jgi:hypothetical protein
MIRNKIKEIANNKDKFKEKSYYLRYKNVSISHLDNEIYLYIKSFKFSFWLYNFKLYNQNYIELSKEEESLLKKSFRKKFKVLDEKEDKKNKAKIEKLLNSINFRE